MILGTAAELGIRNYRTGYLNYDASKPVGENLEQHKRTIEKLEKINRKYNIHGGYQNHSGDRIGGPVWDLYWLLKESDPSYIGIQYDIRHAFVEGAFSWPIGFKLLSPWIKTTAVKDFLWNKVNGRWVLKNVPLGEGMVNFDAYFKEYVKNGIKGPVTIHYEYDLGGAEAGKAKPAMELGDITGFLKRDLNWLKKKQLEYGI
jgi:sugar phosphate isomerase/epimerase